MASPRGELGGIQQRLQESFCASAAVVWIRARWGRVGYRNWPVKRLEACELPWTTGHDNDDGAVMGTSSHLCQAAVWRKSLEPPQLRHAVSRPGWAGPR
jgi:hypothetical protein